MIGKSVLLLTCMMAANSYAMDVNIAPELPYVTTRHDGRIVKIQRIQDQENRLADGFTKTSRQCPPFCVQPIQVAPGVNTIGELELLEFISKKLNRGSGVLVDARTPSWHKKGTIPGSINIPFTLFDPNQPEEITTEALGKLGAYRKVDPSFIDNMWDEVKSLSGDNSAGKIWDFSRAREVVLWCNGMWCGQSPRAIRNLLELGYPAEKIHYYRGGMQAWKQLGLTVIVPERTELSQR
ncbi:MAG TPA: rhodanese-like domain-containing protein [Gammaproteobacteria bacterium]|nr:rhodanese-like domain-containing protein [Gammaproteobacteria bacterium]